jgi:hypothetical protein
MEIRIQETGEVITEHEVAARFPNTSWPLPHMIVPEMLVGCDVVEATSKPTATRFQEVVRDGVEQVGGVWKQKWLVRDLDTAEAAARKVADQEAKREEIKRKRDTLSSKGGYKVVVDGVDKWFHSDNKSKTQQLGLARKADKAQAAGGDMTAGFSGPGPGGLLYWKTMDGSFVLVTPALALAIFDAAEAQDMVLFAVAEQHIAAMLAVEDPQAYDFSAGWPAVY